MIQIYRGNFPLDSDGEKRYMGMAILNKRGKVIGWVDGWV